MTALEYLKIKDTAALQKTSFAKKEGRQVGRGAVIIVSVITYRIKKVFAEDGDNIFLNRRPRFVSYYFLLLTSSVILI